ncbi:VOC family protein [Nioella sp. MMSF_3534]|uniref:VOC family protein n=1 Tax=Nioella sp. MMSF_3534 TaxID=3046720 RepID=UPI00273E3588|nr:VOC family protein [Nioella sp. MMSF_3534]
MTNRLALVAFLARDYDEAIDWFQTALDWQLLEDTDMGGGKRWVRMAPDADSATQFLIARAVDGQADAIGNHAGGRVGYFLHTDDLDASRARMLAAGVRFEEEPRHEPYGTVAVFQDLYGNRWDLIEPK